MTRIDPATLAKAREWVEKDFVTEAHFCAAAEVIANLPDQIIDADKVREVIKKWRGTTNQTMHRVNLVYGVAADDLESLLTPDPVAPSGGADHAPWWFYLGDQIVGTSGHGDVGIQHTVVTHDEDGSPVHSERWIDLSPEDARKLAAILLTAAAHSTQEKK